MWVLNKFFIKLNSRQIFILYFETCPSRAEASTRNFKMQKPEGCTIVPYNIAMLHILSHSSHELQKLLPTLDEYISWIWNRRENTKGLSDSTWRTRQGCHTSLQEKSNRAVEEPGKFIEGKQQFIICTNKYNCKMCIVFLFGHSSLSSISYFSTTLPQRIISGSSSEKKKQKKRYES